MARRKVYGVCALCKTECVRLEHSHIFPDFMYDPLRGPDGRYIVFDFSSPRVAYPGQGGIKEHLLCGHCEDRMQPWERYASQVLFHRDARVVEEDGFWKFLDVDYRTFKLFQLSILWKAGVSTMREFDRVTLGPHEPRIRKMLLEGDPGTKQRYGCTLLADASGVMDSQMWTPDKVNLLGHKGYMFLFNRIFWFYTVSSHRVPDYLENAYLGEDDVLPVCMR